MESEIADSSVTCIKMLSTWLTNWPVRKLYRWSIVEDGWSCLFIRKEGLALGDDMLICMSVKSLYCALYFVY